MESYRRTKLGRINSRPSPAQRGSSVIGPSLWAAFSLFAPAGQSGAIVTTMPPECPLDAALCRAIKWFGAWSKYILEPFESRVLSRTAPTAASGKIIWTLLCEELLWVYGNEHLLWKFCYFKTESSDYFHCINYWKQSQAAHSTKQHALTGAQTQSCLSFHFLLLSYVKIITFQWQIAYICAQTKLSTFSFISHQVWLFFFLFLSWRNVYSCLLLLFLWVT